MKGSILITSEDVDILDKMEEIMGNLNSIGYPEKGSGSKGGNQK